MQFAKYLLNNNSVCGIVQLTQLASQCLVHNNWETLYRRMLEQLSTVDQENN